MIGDSFGQPLAGSLLDRGGAYLNVKNPGFAGGARGDGSTDDTAAVVAALQQARPGEVVFFPAGEYRLATWDAHRLVRPVSLAGAGPGQTVLRGEGDQDFLHILASHASRDLTLEGFRIVYRFFTDGETTIDEIALDNLHIREFFHAIVAIDDECHAIERFILRGSVFDGGSQGINLRAHRRIGSVNVSDCLIQNLRGRSMVGGGIEIGNQSGPSADLGRYIIRNNIIRDIVAQGDWETQAILLRGRLGVVQGNIIENVYNAGGRDADGIYIRCTNTSVEGNVLYNAGGVQGCIVVKGSGRGSVVANNRIFIGERLWDRLTTGISAEGARLTISGNNIEGCSTGIYVAGRVSEQVAVTNNQVFDIALRGIRVRSSGGGISISGNSVIGEREDVNHGDGARTGIHVDPLRSVRGIVISGNQIARLTRAYAVRCRGPSEQELVEDLFITGNQSESPDGIYGIDLAHIGGAVVSNNILRGRWRVREGGVRTRNVEGLVLGENYPRDLFDRSQP